MEFKDASQRWDKRYREADGFLFGQAPNVWLASQARWLELRAAAVRVSGDTPRALAIADGEARNSVWLAKQGWQVDAFDYSAVAVAKAREFASREGVDLTIQQAALEQWDWPVAALDAVLAIFFQFAGPELRSLAIEKMLGALKPGGILVIEGYGPRQMIFKTGGPGIIDHLYTSAMLLDYTRGCDILAWRDADDVISEGTAHVGRSHLVSAVIRKPLI